MTGPQRERWLRTSEVARLLHVAPKTVTSYARRGLLPSLSTLGGHHRFPEAEIRKIAERLTRPAANPWQDGAR